MATVREPIPPHQRSTMTIGNMEERETRVTSPMAEYTRGDGEETGRGPRGGPPRTGRGLIPPAHGDIILTPNHSTSKPLDYHTQSSSSRDDLDYDSGYSNTPEIRTTSLSSDNGSHDERVPVNRRASPISSGVPSSLWSGHESTLDLVEEEDDCNEVDIERDSGNGNDGEVTSPGVGDIPHPMEGSNMFYHHPDDQTLIQVAHRRGISRSNSTDSQIISSGLIDSTTSVNEERGRWRRHSGGRQRTNSLFHKDTHVVRPANISDSKDTFQIQDDLSKENYHFTLSDALITVIEEYKSLLQEQAYFNGLRTASTSPSFDGNSIDHFQATSSTIQTPPTTTPITSRSNVPPPTRSNDRSLLHLMEQPLSLNTAESTAHGLLQYIARILDPSSIEFRTSKVVQLPSNFITTMRREKYLLYSFTNTSCPIRGGIDWAPPRKTIIHNIHSPVSWKDLPKALNVQRNRCIGCGMSLESKEFLREAKIMVGLNHPCIVQLIGVTRNKPLMLVQELVPYWALVDYLYEGRHPKPTIPIMKLWAAEIASGMTYLEKKRFVHRDLAARNILVASQDLVKISDYGLSRAVGANSDYYKASQGGRWPVKWYAPESINYGTFSHASDVWSYGVTLWEMFSFGEPPYGEMTGAEVLDFIENKHGRLELPPNCPMSIYKLMLDCWSLDISQRPTFEQLHDYFNDSEEHSDIPHKELYQDPGRL